MVNLLGVDCFANVVGLRTTVSPIHPEAKGTALLAKLSKLPELEEMSLFMSEATDNDLAFLARHKRLRVLELPFSPVTGVGLKGFASKNQLHVLSLRASSASDDGLAAISSFENLEELDLGTDAYCAIPRLYSRAGLAHLVSLSKLKKLNLWGADLNDAELAEVAKLSSLEQLVFWPRKATGKGILQLKTLSNLRYLDADLDSETNIPPGELEMTLVSLAAKKDAVPSEK